MRIPGIGTLRRTARRIENRFTPGVLILLYHRVAELPSDPYLLNVTPQHFAEHLEILRQQGCRLMHLQELIQALQDGNLPHRGVVITFDDGCVDNLYNAKPLLEHYDIPATVFVTSGYVGQDREFWWDELDRLLLQPGTLPKTLHLNIDGSTYEWELGNDAHYSEDDQKRDRSWHLYQQDDPTQRHRLFRSLHQRLNSLPIKERWPVLDELSAWAGAGLRCRSTHRILSPDEVVDLAKGGLVEVGAHTVTHPVLSSLAVSAQQDEIRQSKAALEKILDLPVATFAYPHGSRSDYTQDTVKIAREAGFSCACSNFADMVWQSTDHFQLPRVIVFDWDGETFARRLEEWLRG